MYTSNTLILVEQCMTGVIQKGNTAYVWDHGTVTVSKCEMVETEGHKRG